MQRFWLSRDYPLARLRMKLPRNGLASLRLIAGIRLAVMRSHPASLLLVGYLSYMALGWAALSLPVAQASPQAGVDVLFLSVSAVSTTGLVTIDPGTDLTFFGQIVLLALFQIGGIGYMTLGSFALLTAEDRLSPVRRKMAKAAFSLPDGTPPGQFIRAVVLFTLICEVMGAAALYAFFSAEGVERPLWNAVFHAVSAFCTAGFSLNSDSLAAFRGHVGINLVIGALCFLGAVGFLVVVDAFRNVTGRTRRLGFTSKVILRLTLGFITIATLLLFASEPALAELAPWERLLAAFFQAVSASTTAGFNSVPLDVFAHSAMIVLLFLMIFGAAPSGTGGGLKTTTFAVLYGLVSSTLREREKVRFEKRKIPDDRIRVASTAFAYYFAMLCAALFLLGVTDPGIDFRALLFEAVSALGTVGLSIGATGELSPLGQCVVMVLMIAGRVGVLSFGLAVARRDASFTEVQDNELVL